MGMTTWGPRGYPGSKGLTGFSGYPGAQGPVGPAPTVVDNGNGTYTITGSNGSVTISDGLTPQDGVDFYSGNSGDYITYVFGTVPNGAPKPTVDINSGEYNGTQETMPTGSVTWYPHPFTTLGHTTYVTLNRYVHDTSTDTWSLKAPVWTSPAIYTRLENETTNRFVAYSFTRSIGIPTTPTGGDYNSPNPISGNWSDGIPAGSNPVYMTKRLFTEFGGYPQDAAWSTPRLLGAAGTGTKFKFSATEFGGYQDTPFEGAIWMVICTQTDGVNWVCDYANPIKIKGEDGLDGQSMFKAFAYKRHNGPDPLLERPTGGDFLSPTPVDGFDGGPSGWTDVIPQGTADLYVSNRLFTADGESPQEDLWSESELFSGQNAYSFVVQVDSHIISFDSDDNPVSPDEINFTAVKQNTSNDVTWTTVPAGALGHIAANNVATDTFKITKEEFNTITDDVSLGEPITVKFIATAGSLSDEVTIAKVGDGYVPIAGIDYSDGISVFQSKIYKSAPVTPVPSAPSGGYYDGTVESIPSGWSEDPIAPAAGEAVWESNFVYLASQDVPGQLGQNVWDDKSQPLSGGPLGNGTGKPWSTPIQYFYVPQEGVDFFSGSTFQSYIFKNTSAGASNKPNTPAGGTYNTTDNPEETLPSGGWTDSPVTPADDEITWVSNRLYTLDPNSPTGDWDADAWSEPSRFSGSTTLTGVLTNETDMVSSDANGNNPVFNNDEGGEFFVYFGSLDVTTECTFEVEGGTDNGSNSVKTQNALTMSIVKASGEYTLSGANWDSTNKESFMLLATHTPSGFITRKRYLISKSIEGNIGVSGTSNRLDIAYATSDTGANAAYPSLSFNPRNYATADPSGKTYMGTNVVTWVPDNTPNTLGEPTTSGTAGDYEWSLMTGENGTDGLSSRIDFIYANNVSPNPPTLAGHVSGSNFGDPVESNEWLGTNVVTGNPPGSVDVNVLNYEWTKFRGEDGNDGDDGEDGISVALSNPSHTIPTDESGASGDYTGSGTTLKVFQGAIESTFITTASPIYPSNNGEWRIHSVTDTNISSGSITDSGTYATVGNASGFTTGVTPLTASSIFNIKGKSITGTTYDLSVQQSFNKNLAGGPPVAQITATGSGTVTAASNNISVIHPSAGNNISVSWQFRLKADGTNRPSASTDIQLKANGVVISTVAFGTISQEPAEGGNSAFWFAFKHLTTYIHSNSEDDAVEFTISMINAGSYDTPLSKDYAVITTVEEL